MSFAEWLVWLGSAGALGVISSVVLTVIKLIFPALRDVYAKIASGVIAAIVSALALLLVPFLPQMPLWVEQFWPIVVWAVSQIWYELTKGATT